MIFLISHLLKDVRCAGKNAQDLPKNQNKLKVSVPGLMNGKSLVDKVNITVAQK